MAEGRREPTSLVVARLSAKAAQFPDLDVRLRAIQDLPSDGGGGGGQGAQTRVTLQGNDAAQLAETGSAEFPFVATSYRLTEHFHYWTKHNRINSALQPQFFVELSHQLAEERGITNGGWVRVWNKRGSVKAKAVVTKRIKPLICDGKTVHVVGVPLHWGFTGNAKKGFGPNSLTVFIGDANIETPESKAFLVNIEPSEEPVA